MPTAMNLPSKLGGRLEKLAAAAGSTPEKILPYVMRDGFDATEHFVQQVNQGIAEADAGEMISHEEAMCQLQAIVAKSETRSSACLI